MRLLDEIAHRHNTLAPRVTDFYFVSGNANRYKVVETATPTTIVGGTVTELRYDYVVHVFRPTGWVEVAVIEEDHAETAQHAANIAHRLIATAEGS